jgi:hypothetical protein
MYTPHHPFLFPLHQAYFLAHGKFSAHPLPIHIPSSEHSPVFSAHTVHLTHHHLPPIQKDFCENCPKCHLLRQLDYIVRQNSSK